jgi:sulfite dehydrogenase
MGNKPLPAYVNWKDPAALVVHSSTTIETRRSAFGTSVITPAEQLYIRNNLPPPDGSIVADRDAWEVSIEGVKKPRKLTLRELKTMGVETTAMVLQCSGNGRGYFPSKPSGTPWQVGAAGCVVWSGVPVRWVADALGGVAEGMRFLTGTGGEKLPEGLDPLSVIVERSVPAAAIADALLALEPALGAGDERQVLDQLARARRWQREGGAGADPWRGLWWPERRQTSRGVARRGQELARGALRGA